MDRAGASFGAAGRAPREPVSAGRRSPSPGFPGYGGHSRTSRRDLICFAKT